MAQDLKLNACKLALAVGIVWAVGVFLMALIAMSNGYGMQFVDFMSSFYIGYKADLAGAFMGLIWGFLDGFIGTYIIAWLYNKLIK